jgi:hypothetical protein
MLAWMMMLFQRVENTKSMQHIQVILVVGNRSFR